LAAFIVRQVGHLDGQVGRQDRQSQNKANYDEVQFLIDFIIHFICNLEHLLTIFLGRIIPF
jgi:hypothetical protein